MKGKVGVPVSCLWEKIFEEEEEGGTKWGSF
jgi:hypothetical protein